MEPLLVQAVRCAARVHGNLCVVARYDGFTVFRVGKETDNLRFKLKDEDAALIQV